MEFRQSTDYQCRTVVRTIRKCHQKVLSIVGFTFKRVLFLPHLLDFNFVRSKGVAFDLGAFFVQLHGLHLFVWSIAAHGCDRCASLSILLNSTVWSIRESASLKQQLLGLWRFRIAKQQEANSIVVTGSRKQDETCPHHPFLWYSMQYHVRVRNQRYFAWV